MAMALTPPDNSASFSRSLLADYDIADTRYPTTAFPADSLSRSPQSLASPWPTDYRPDTLRSKEPTLSTSYDSQPVPNSSSRVNETSNYHQQPEPVNAMQDLNPVPQLPSQQQTLPPEARAILPGQLLDRPTSMLDTTPRHPNLVALPAKPPQLSSDQYAPPIIPLSASPTYTPQVSQIPRAQPLQPTYITQPAPNAVNPIFTPQPPQEEVCVECAMRDQDMADVDVTSPGVWRRDSDIFFEELKRQEKEDEENGIAPPADRPKSIGHALSEKNLKIWLSINPREPSSRHKTLLTYVKSQKSLLEKEALAHAQALQEARQLDSRMRDAYSQLRRSAYDTGSSAAPIDDSGGVRIKPPQSPAYGHHLPHNRSHSRDVTLLENGMIVEHVDVRREEREARDRRRREEKRVRKSSRGSAYDVTSIISNQSYAPLTDSGVGLRPYSRYSQASAGRPMSVLTNPNNERPDIPRAYSQASFSDVQSLNSASPRRSRFFGGLNSGWRSQNSLAPSGLSGSMVDMHLALQHDVHTRNSVFDPNTLRQSQVWAPTDPHHEINQSQSYGTSKKKKKGLAKIWDKMKGGRHHKNETSSRDTSHTFERNAYDNSPLAPPPPLSSLVRGEPNGRHASTPSLSGPHKAPGSHAPGMSPPTPPSSILPSPASSRPSVHPEISIDGSRTHLGGEDQEMNEETIGKMRSRNIHPVTSEPDFRRVSQAPPSTPVPPIPQNTVAPAGMSPMVREKSLPPIPPGERIPPPDARPQTLYTFDSSHTYRAPQAPFRTNDVRRQSFGGPTVRPNTSQTLPIGSQSPYSSRRQFSGNYSGFEGSRHSLGHFPHETARNTMSSPAPSKRRSKFGLTSIFGRKQAKDVYSDENTAHGLPYDVDEGMENGYAYSRNSTINYGRASVASRRALEEVVSQDSEFVAYRYPSGEQRLDLFR